jgi:hypothetical protein
LVVLARQPAWGEAQDPPAATVIPKVTSHSLEYCEMLAGRFNALAFEAAVPPSSEVVDLSTEGQRMCALGQVRGGIMRLRKALMLLQHVAEAR